MKVITNQDLRKQYKRKVDNRMHNFGDTDLVKKVIRINKKKAKGIKGELLDSIVHEAMHAKHPMMKEKTVRNKTAKTIKHLTKKNKKRYYGLVQ